MRNENDLCNRAVAAYFKYCSQIGALLQQPSDVNIWYDENDTKYEYVVLQNINGLLAVYRIKWSKKFPNGLLKHMKRIPKFIKSTKNI